MSSTTAAIYVRQSLDAAGDRLAVSRQLEACTDILEQRGWQLARVFEDNSVSASDAKKDRPGYSAMINAYRGGEFTALVCWDLDRLSRQPRQLEDWIDAAESGSLLVVTANGEADLTTDGGRMYARIKLAVARAEVERKSVRQRAAARQRAADGRPPLGVRLTGYTPQGDLVEAEAELVRDMFARFAAGDTLRGISRALGDAGHRTRHGGQWNPSTVRSILVNPRYAGQAIYDGKPTGGRGGWPALVDEATFDLVQARLADPRRKTRETTERRHLGSGLFLCGTCQRPVRSLSIGYRCPDGHVTRTRTHIDDYVLQVVRARLALPDVAAVVAPANSDRARAAEVEVRRQRARLVQVERDYDDDLIDAHRFRVKADKVRAALSAAESERMAAVGDPALRHVLSAPDPVAAFDSAPLGIRRGVVAAFVTVQLHRHPQGRKGFDPDTVTIAWVR